jgi:glucosamine-6-phosphate deaminase
MDEIVVGGYQELSDRAADFVVERLKEKPNLVLGLATGSTPVGLYQNLAKEYKRGKVSFKSVTTFNLDEYCGLGSNDSQSYGVFMDENLFNHIDVNRDNVFFPACDQREGQYDLKIKEAGGIDLQILGIGRNGHIGFNEPGSSFSSRTRVVELAESTVKDNARFFTDSKDVPRKAVTMGLATIMEAKEVLLLASGEKKKEAVYRLLHKGESEELPASVLRHHRNAIVIVDSEAGGGRTDRLH